MKAACVAQKTKSKPNNNKTRKTKQKPYTQQKTQAAKTNPNNNKIKTNLQTITWKDINLGIMHDLKISWPI